MLPNRSHSGRVLALGGGLALALVLAVTAAALIPQDACGCATPADLSVLNYSRQDATIGWNQAGILGTPLRGLSDGAVAPHCSTLVAGLREGVVDVSVTAGGTIRNFQIHVRDGLADYPVTIVIGADGRVADPTYGSSLGGLTGNNLC